eukprot:6309676-Amphidinium_carterae.1
MKDRRESFSASCRQSRLRLCNFYSGYGAGRTLVRNLAYLPHKQGNGQVLGGYRPAPPDARSCTFRFYRSEPKIVPPPEKRDKRTETTQKHHAYFWTVYLIFVCVIFELCGWGGGTILCP